MQLTGSCTSLWYSSKGAVEAIG